MNPSRQPWLHELVATLQAPTVALSDADGQIRAGTEGVLHADVRVLSSAVLSIDGAPPERVAGGIAEGSDGRFTGLVRSLGDGGADPTVRIERVRHVSPGEVTEEIQVISYAQSGVTTEVTLDLAADLARVEAIKSGRADGAGVAIKLVDQNTDSVALRWGADGVEVTFHATGAGVAATTDGESATVRWPVHLPTAGVRTLGWRLRANVEGAPVVGATAVAPDWADVQVNCDDHRLSALVKQSFADLAGLRMAPADAPEDVFLAAGAPWFFTLFGRDSIWAARLLLPFGHDLAAGTLRALAARQGRRVDHETAEAPGKILHELRQADSSHDVGAEEAAMSLPPVYYGSVDSTPLWVCLLHDAWRAGMPPEQVRVLMPHLQAALSWMLEYGDPDGDGFLEYLDTSGHGLANQGWKDSGDSIRFADGRQATGPVALCEVQGYAYEAAVHGADLLDAFDMPGAPELRKWAVDLATRFRACFWVADAEGPYPALALDGEKRAVDSLTSNIGHLVGTGLLNEAETALVIDRLTAPDLDGGFGLRTMSSHNGGFSPLSYHCGSVWPHDTAIVIRALSVAGHADRAFGLIEGLLATGVHFSGRLPELYSGDARATAPWPIPYPAACRPQAWAAAAIGAITQALLGLEIDVPRGAVRMHPGLHSPFGALSVNGLAAGPERFSVEVAADGSIHREPVTLRHAGR
jgi:glycogen debranching enzyme